ncbi:hypothetical protein Y032_0009g701 [Ancylostoma ceylanicum]|uniref:Uncharacterized protein n=1 Tax=Ancylostoma ceylanicum TaxID=53326 RepID=A0A016VKU5_9BILA|nr:hypothetical protein Y032_0009g701 [Ancylostoma ceylanicum]
MFFSFLAGDSIIIGVDSDGAVGKAADSQYQNHCTIPDVIKVFAHSSLFGDTKGKVSMVIHFTGLLLWQYIFQDFLFGNTFHGTSRLAIHLTRFVCLASWQSRLRGCQTNLAKCIAIHSENRAALSSESSAGSAHIKQQDIICSGEGSRY